LKSAEIPPDELERARGPRVLDLEHAQQTNEYWSILLSDSQANPRRLDLIRTTISGMQRVTAADVLRAARTYLLDNKAWKLVVLSEGVSPAAP
jgi:zinc protease